MFYISFRDISLFYICAIYKVYTCVSECQTLLLVHSCNDTPTHVSPHIVYAIY